MTIKRIPSEVDVLWETVIITGDSQQEVQNEIFDVMEESPDASFIHPVYIKSDGKWVATGQVLRAN